MDWSVLRYLHNAARLRSLTVDGLGSPARIQPIVDLLDTVPRLRVVLWGCEPHKIGTGNSPCRADGSPS